MAAASTKEQNWNTHDGACTSCRARKIRCGREKPHCSSCIRDKVECEYASPPKRVNHIKVLCQNFDNIQERLIWMQDELSTLTDVFKSARVIEKLGIDVSQQSRNASSGDCTMTTDSEDIGSGRAAAGYIVRDKKTLVEKYHGPRTLVARCHEFGSHLIAQGGHGDLMEGLAQKMEAEAGTDMHIHTGPEVASGSAKASVLCLPPRRLLHVVLDSFMKQGDWTTDIFSRESLLDAAEHVYKEPNSPSSEPWAVCFNLIMLLVLGAESEVRGDDPFLRPALQATHAAVQKPSFFMSLRLVSVQALALLSIISQEYHTESLGDAVFAQACNLAKAMGLHQAGHDATPSDLSPTEAEERQKVFRCLYMRDRSSAITRGSLTWLPSCRFTERDLPSQLEGGTYKARWELAGLQDELHGLLSSAGPPETNSPADRRAACTRLKQRLAGWAQANRIPSPTRPTTLEDVSLHLAFLGTSISALEAQLGGDGSCRTSERMLRDARLCCALVAAACTSPPSRDLTDRVNILLNTMPPSSSGQAEMSRSSSLSSWSPSPVIGPSSFSDALLPPPSTGGEPHLRSSPALAPLPLHRLAADFPPAAIFIVARHIVGLGQDIPGRKSSRGALEQWHDVEEESEDAALLEALLACFQSVSASDNEKSYVAKLGRVMQSLVDIVRATIPDRVDDTHQHHGEGAHAINPITVSPVLGFHDGPARTISMPHLNQQHCPPLSRTSNAHSAGGSAGMSATTSLSHSAGSTSWSRFLQDAAPSTQPSSISNPTPPSMFAGSLAETPLDISQFLSQLGGLSAADMWDGPQVPMADDPPQNHLPTPDLPGAMGRRRRKRTRTDPSRRPGEDDGIAVEL